MRQFKKTLRHAIASALIFGSTLGVTPARPVQAEIDPCPRAQRQFDEAVNAKDAAISQMKGQIQNAVFPAAKVEDAFRTQAIDLVQRSYRSFVNKLSTAKDFIPPAESTLWNIAAREVDAVWNTPAGRAQVEKKMAEARRQFEEEKQQELREVEAKEGQLKQQLAAERQKLSSQCDYGVLAVLFRSSMELFKIDMRIEDGMVKVGDFKTAVPEVIDNKVMLGRDHVLFDLPVIDSGELKVGGFKTAVPEVIDNKVTLGGQVLFDLPVIDRGHVNVGGTRVFDLPTFGGDHGGLRVTIGDWKF